MWCLAATVPDGLIFGLAPVLLVGIFSLIAFLIRTAGKNESRLNVNDEVTAALARASLDHESRLRSLERR